MRWSALLLLLMMTIGVRSQETGVGSQETEEGNDLKALNTYRQAERLIAQLPDDDLKTLKSTSNLINIYVNLAELCNDLKRRDEASRYARKAAKEAKAKSDKTIRGTVFPQIGGILLDNGHTEEAARWLRLGYQEAMEARLYGNALVAASHLMTIEATDSCLLTPDQNSWKAKADKLLPKVSSDYPRGVYYMAVADINLKAGELAEVQKAQQQVIELEGVKKRMTPERTKEYLRQVEEEREEAYARRHQARIRLITSVLIGVLVVFACYILWQQHRRKKARERAERQKEEQFIEGLESERSRMARELHDGISNQLLAIEMKLASDGLTEQTRRMLTESRERIRQVSHELMPPEFKHDTLDEVLANYICSINGAQGCEITYQSQPAEAAWEDIPAETAFEAYRIVQEAIGNALKHAAATLIAVGMKREGQRIVITIADNTTRQASAEETSHGIGMRTMNQRAKAIGGQLTYTPTRFGTVLQVSFDI